MKSILKLFKIAFLVVGLFVLTDNFQVSAGDEFEIEGGCSTSTSCSQSTFGYCTCGATGCTGCFIESGSGGCGRCVKAP